MTNSDQKMKDDVREYFSDASLPDFGVDARFFPTAGKRLVDFAKIEAGNRVLDVAAGRGAILFPAAERVGKTGEVIGIDLAEGMVNATVKELDERRIENASMQLMDAEYLDFDSETFDRVTCGFALFFFPDLQRALREFLRVLKPGGILGATTFGMGGDQMDWYEPLLDKYDLGRTIPGTDALEHPEALHNAFSMPGFADINVSQEVIDSVYADEEDWWSHLWNTADRMQLETLSEEKIVSLKREAFDGVQSLKANDAIRVPYSVLFARGKKYR